MNSDDEKISNFELLHTMFGIILRQEIELNLWLLCFVVLIILLNFGAGIYAWITNRVFLTIFNGILAIINGRTLGDTIHRIRKARKKLKEEQELFDEVFQYDDR